MNTMANGMANSTSIKKRSSTLTKTFPISLKTMNARLSQTQYTARMHYS